MMRIWLMPRWEHERSEFERMHSELGFDSELLAAKALNGGPQRLEGARWRELENADSTEPMTFEQAKQLALEYEIGDLFDSLAAALRDGLPLPMPLVLEYQPGQPGVPKWDSPPRPGKHLYLVGGNTRLLACRALGITPEVWIFSLD